MNSNRSEHRLLLALGAPGGEHSPIESLRVNAAALLRRRDGRSWREAQAIVALIGGAAEKPRNVAAALRELGYSKIADQIAPAPPRKPAAKPAAKPTPNVPATAIADAYARGDQAEVNRLIAALPGAKPGNGGSGGEVSHNPELDRLMGLSSGPREASFDAKSQVFTLGAEASPKNGGGYEVGTGKWKTPWWADQIQHVERTKTPPREQTPQEIETHRDRLDHDMRLGKYAPGAPPRPSSNPDVHVVGSQPPRSK
jgi:hypothetical protein